MALSIEQLTTFFGWCTVINSVALTIATVIMLVTKQWVARVHGKLFNMPEADVRSGHFNFLASYKAMILALNIVPYVVLKFFM